MQARAPAGSLPGTGAHSWLARSSSLPRWRRAVDRASCNRPPAQPGHRTYTRKDRTLTRTCVILNGHIWSLTWADVDTAHLMFWRHGAVRRGADARARRSIDAQTDITLPTSLGLSGYIFSAPCGVSAGHEPFSGDTPTQVGTNRVICAGQWWRRLAADPYRLIVISPS